MKMRSIFNSNKIDLESGEIDSDGDPGSRKKLNRHPFVEIVESTASEYTQRSTIHGISYLGDGERHLLERSWWLIMFVGSVFSASCLIYDAYKKMTENPVIESPSLDPVPLWEVPFPAITICPVITGKLTPFGRNVTNWPKFVQNLMKPQFLKFSEEELDPTLFVNLLLHKSHKNNYDVVRKVFPEIYINESQWVRNHEFSGGINPDKTIMYMGPCRTFNMFNEKDLKRDGVTLSTPANENDKKKSQWNRDFGFKKGFPLEHYNYPLRSFGMSDYLHVAVNVNQSERLIGYDSKIEILVHAPDECPTQTRHSTNIITDDDKYIIVEITPHLITSEGIKKYKPSVRRCYYAEERHLKYYKVYTQNHCEAECNTNYTLTRCGCIPYNLPHFNDTRICTGSEGIDCFFKAEYDIYRPEFIGDKNDIHAPIDDCDCLPTCTHLSYAVQVTKLDNTDGKDFIQFQFRYKSPFFKKDTRSELHSLSEFLSSSGGSLGLFLGVSFFSIFELFYFCTVRLYLHSKRFNREKNRENSSK